MIDELEFLFAFRPVDDGNRDKQLEFKCGVIAQGFDGPVQVLYSDPNVQVTAIPPERVVGQTWQSAPDGRIELFA